MDSRLALLMVQLFFLLVAAVLAAPHLSWPTARLLALLSIGCALVFGFVAWWSERR